MKTTWLERMGLVAILCLSAACYAAALDWGLPAPRSDALLFGDRPRWTGAELAAFDPAPAAGPAAADLDASPLDRTAARVSVNATDADRAQIVRRFRLFSRQPDEMNTLMALGRMKPAALDLDPKMFKYGGLWVYPVGGLIKAASMAGWIELRADKTFYYDNPEAFGRMYVAARAYACGWALVGIIATWALGRRLTGSHAGAAATAAAFAGLPVVFNAAHEAKPHGAGAVLTLVAVLAAVRFVRGGRTRAAVAAGCLCGAAAAMVISGLLALVVLPAMICLRPAAWKSRAATLLLSTLGAGVVYAACNPYVIRDLLSDRTVLTAHFKNSADFYAPSGRWDNLAAAARCAGEAASPVWLIGGVAAAAFGAAAGLRRGQMRSARGCGGTCRATAWLLAAAAVPVLVQLVVFAAGQPAEYARFAIVPAAAAAAGAIALCVRVRPVALRYALLGCLPLAVMAFYTRPYLRAALAEGGPDDTRDRAAAYIASLGLPERAEIQVYAEPAPYCFPPVDLWRYDVVLTRPGVRTDAAVVIGTLDHASQADVLPGYRGQVFSAGPDAPIGWASKPIQVLVRVP